MLDEDGRAMTSSPVSFNASARTIAGVADAVGLTAERIRDAMTAPA